MRLSLLSYSMIFDAAARLVTPDILCRICLDNGIRCMDLTEIELGLYGAEKLRSSMTRHGIECGCVISNVDFPGRPDGAERRLRKALDNCEKMGAGTLMIVPGQPFGRGMRRVRKLSRGTMMEEAVSFFSMAVSEGEKRGIRVGLEDTPQREKPFCSAAEMKELLGRVPGLGLIFDTGNFLIADPAADLLECYEELRPYIIRIHLKDVKRGRYLTTEKCADGPGIVPVVTGSGIIPMDGFLKKLEEDGYDGDLCVEYAASPLTHGKAHAKALSAYTGYIRGSLPSLIV